MNALYQTAEDEDDRFSLDLSYEQDDWSAHLKNSEEALPHRILTPANAPTAGVGELVEVDWDEFGPVIEFPPFGDTTFISESLFDASTFEDETETGVIDVPRSRHIIFRKTVKFRISDLPRWRPRIDITEDSAEE